VDNVQTVAAQDTLWMLTALTAVNIQTIAARGSVGTFSVRGVPGRVVSGRRVAIRGAVAIRGVAIRGVTIRGASVR
jgi:hypothetical protein